MLNPALLCSLQGVIATRPSIIHIVADDLGWNDVALHGSAQIPTPTISRLSAEGVRFDHFYVNPVCSPTRSAMMSGRQTIHTGIYSPLTGLCVLLQVGKWHVGNYNWSWTPEARGFKSFYGYYTGAEDYFTHVSTAGGYDMQQADEGGAGNADWTAVGTYSTELPIKKAVELIEAHAAAKSGKPMYLYLA